MKKSLILALAVGIIVAVSVGAYAHGGRGSNDRGWFGGHMRGWSSRSGPMMGGWGTRGGHGYCGGYGPWHGGRSEGNAPTQSGTVPQVISEDKVKENAEAYITKYLPGYTIETIEKDEWRPMYYVTLKGENDAALQMLIHGFDGQVMHVLSKTAE